MPKWLFCKIFRHRQTDTHTHTRTDHSTPAQARGNYCMLCIGLMAGIALCVAWDGVKILDHDSQSISRKIREALHIRMGSSLMNRDVGIDVSHVWDPLFLS